MTLNSVYTKIRTPSRLRLSKRLNKLLLPKVASPSVAKCQSHAVFLLRHCHPSHLVPLQPSQQCQPSPNHKPMLCSSNSANPYRSQFCPTLNSLSPLLPPKPFSQSQLSNQFSTCCQPNPSQHLGQLLVAWRCKSLTTIPVRSCFVLLENSIVQVGGMYTQAK